MTKRLELGSGESPTPGYLHFDIREDVNADVVGDAGFLLDYFDCGSFDAIKANHILEHFSWLETTRILNDWWDVLTRGGVIHIEVPNMKWQTTAYVNGEISASEFVYFAYGGQDYEGNSHFAAFDADLLRHYLSEAGFIDIRIMDIGQVLIAEAIK